MRTNYKIKANQKGLLISMKLLKNIKVIFTTIFLNVYIFKALDNNFELYICGIIFTIIAAEVLSLITLRLLSKKNAIWIYRLSFIVDILLIIAVLFVKHPTFPIILVFYFLQELSNSLFYVPHENGEMKATDKDSANKFLAKSTIFTSLAKVVSPFLSGLAIDKLSYTVLFILVGVVAIVMFVLSLFLNDFDVKETRLRLKEFRKKAFKYPHVKYFYWSFTFFRLSMGGTIYTILPVILFMKVGSEFSLGSYSSLFALLTIITLSIFMFIQNKKLNIILSTVMISISCIMITAWTTLTSFIIFNAIYYMFEKLYENEIFSMRLNAIKVTELESYKKEHHVFYDIFANIGYIIGYLLILLLYKTISYANILSIIISVIGLFIIISAILLIKSKSHFQATKEKVKDK